MFDVAQVSKRFFEVKIGDTVLELEPPKVKTLRKMSSIFQTVSGQGTSDEDAVEALVKCVCEIFRKNRQKRDIDEAFIEENLDVDQMYGIVSAFFDWLNHIQQSKN